MTDNPRKRGSPKDETLTGMDALKERVRAMENRQEQMDVKLAEIKKVLSGNNGDSLADQVERILWLIDGNAKLGIKGVRANITESKDLLDKFEERDKRIRYILVGLGLGVGVQAAGIIGIVVKLSELFTILP